MASMFDSVPSTSKLLSAYAAVSTFLMLLQTIFNQIVSNRMREYITSKLSDVFAAYFSSDFTFTAENGRWDTNETFRAAEVYLPTKIGPSTRSLRILSSVNRESAVPDVAIPVGGKVDDVYEGMQLSWTLESRQASKEHPEIKLFKLTCKRQYKDRVLNVYLPHVISTAQSIVNKRKSLKIYTYDTDSQYWQSSEFNHPASFDTLALEPELKNSIIDDLDMFVKRKEYFKRVGRAWKRGYLLYGPPGTGKSTLVAAMANHLRYNIYDLQFASVTSDSELRNVLTSTTNRSILLIEDIDCNCKVSHDRQRNSNRRKSTTKSTKDTSVESRLTLSGLLNFIDGLWSSFGDERIIVFTTNHKDKLDPALLRPGRMDFHIYMGHCKPIAFRKLAYLYLGIKDHKLFEDIEDRIEKIQVTPAEVAQQLMASNVPEDSLTGLNEFLGMKRIAQEDVENDSEEDVTEKKDSIDEEKSKSSKKEKSGFGLCESETGSIYLT